MSYTGVDIEKTMEGFIDFAAENVEYDREPLSGKVGMNHGAMCIAQALLHLSDSIRYLTYRLGTADAATPMGALEHVASELSNIAKAIESKD